MSSVCLLPVAGCLEAAEEVLGLDRKWEPANCFAEPTTLKKQIALLDVYERLRKVIPGLSEINSIASLDYTVINRFLKEQGFTIQLDPCDGELCVASVLDVLVEWIEVGDITKVYRDKQEFPAAKIKHGVNFLKHDDFVHPIVTLDTKSGDTVYMLVHEAIEDPFQLLDFIQQISQQAVLNNRDEWGARHEGVIFPMIDYNEEIDISWIVGMNTVGTDGQPAIISQAKQQTKFKMNQIGARVKSAAAMSMCRGISAKPKPYVIDQPFLCWILRKSVLGFDPIFVGHFGEANWKNPGSLEDM